MEHAPGTCWVCDAQPSTTELERLKEINAELLAAALIAAQTLDTLTTRDFELGKDRPAREALQAAITKATGS